MSLKIGAHVPFLNTNPSIAVKRAVEIGANTIQIFGASPVQWRAPLPDKDKAKEFRDLVKKHKITPVFLHAPYLINIASPKDQLAAMSKTLLGKHLAIANELGAFGVIFHIGTRGESSEKEAEDKVVAVLKKILEEVREGKLLIENTAGAGNLVGKTLDEVGRIIKRVRNKRVGFCYDTAHGFEAGVLTDTSEEGIKKFVRELDKHIGLERLWAIHVNDSKTPANSNKDRHENIGFGYLGDGFFKNLLSNKDLRRVPMILEVPGLDGNGPDKENIDRLLSLSKSK